MNVGNLILAVNSVTVHTWFVMTVYDKMWQILLETGTAILLQSTTKFNYEICQVFIKKCDIYYKFGLLYYKMPKLFQNAAFITNCDSTLLNEDLFFQCFQVVMK